MEPEFQPGFSRHVHYATDTPPSEEQDGILSAVYGNATAAMTGGAGRLPRLTRMGWCEGLREPAHETGSAWGRPAL